MILMSVFWNLRQCISTVSFLYCIRIIWFIFSRYTILVSKTGVIKNPSSRGLRCGFNGIFVNCSASYRRSKHTFISILLHTLEAMVQKPNILIYKKRSIGFLLLYSRMGNTSKTSFRQRIGFNHRIVVIGFLTLGNSFFKHFSLSRKNYFFTIIMYSYQESI